MTRTIRHLNQLGGGYDPIYGIIYDSNFIIVEDEYSDDLDDLGENVEEGEQEELDDFVPENWLPGRGEVGEA